MAGTLCLARQHPVGQRSTGASPRFEITLAAHRLAGEDCPRASAVVREVARGIRRALGFTAEQKAPVLVGEFEEQMGQMRTGAFIRFYVTRGFNHGGDGLMSKGATVPGDVDLLGGLVNKACVR
jgi:hypothetical protein